MTLIFVVSVALAVTPDTNRHMRLNIFVEQFYMALRVSVM